MNQPSVKVEKENGAVTGSLGTLLAAYTDSSDENDSDTEKGKCEPKVESPKVINLLPNPFANSEAIINVSPGETSTTSRPRLRLSDRCAAVFPLKTEPSENDEQDNSMNSNSSELVKNPNFTKQVKNNEEESEEGDKCVLIHGMSTSVPNDNRNFVDFASLKREQEDTLELDEEDFFDTPVTYIELREVKREVDIDSGTSDSETDSEDENTDEEEEDQDTNKTGENKKSKKKILDSDGPRVKGEFRLCDLPPIEDLHISVPHDDCQPIGIIKSVVEPLVVVEAYPNTPALNLDSVLFLDKGDRALGRIFDVIGPVTQPMYCVRFNSKEHIEKNKVEVGMHVYCAPKTPYTSFVFLAQLRKMKGSDASWLNDDEPPMEEVDYSDDEMERIAKKRRRNRRKANLKATEADAMVNDGESSEGSQMRGQKRHIVPDKSTDSTSSEGNAQFPPANNNPYPPFTPPMVPGFFPGGPMHLPYPGGFHQQIPPQFRGHRMRGFRPRSHQHFRPPMPNPPSGNFFYHPPGPRPWCPPGQWQNQPRGNFSFGGAQPFIPPNGANGAIPHPPPPPPPPPPGLS